VKPKGALRKKPPWLARRVQHAKLRALVWFNGTVERLPPNLTNMKHDKLGRHKKVKMWTTSNVLDLLKVVTALADIILKFLR